MNLLEVRLRDEILRRGPIPFSRFMAAALYDPEYGYYRRPHDPFGKAGDFYTAEQLQPVFGILIAHRVRALYRELGAPADFSVVELGAGRAEMAAAFSEWRYVPVEVGQGLPERFSGVVFANEFFDALPVDVAAVRGGAFLQLCVGWNGERFVWIENGPLSAAAGAYVSEFIAPRKDGDRLEVNLEALRWIERIAAALDRGFLLAIDYGYTTRESARFPQGTLMSYRRHAALDDVLAGPGERDITAHVCFTALESHAERCGLHKVRFETLARTLLDAGESDAFSSALAAAGPREQERRRLQLKTLLFSMGESFRTLLLRKEGT